MTAVQEAAQGQRRDVPHDSGDFVDRLAARELALTDAVDGMLVLRATVGMVADVLDDNPEPCVQRASVVLREVVSPRIDAYIETLDRLIRTQASG